MKDPHTIVIKPLITEKTTDIKERVGTICFEVAAGVNKVEIRNAVEKIYKVKVQSVRVANVQGKKRRLGRYLGHRPDWRKAFVTLREGEKSIEYFE